MIEKQVFLGMLDRLVSRGMLSRREFLTTALKMGIGLSTAKVWLRAKQAEAGAAAKGEVIVVTWGGWYEENQRKAFGTPFAQETGMADKWISPIEYSKMKAAILSGNPTDQYGDMTEIGADIEGRAIKEGFLEKIDYNIVKKEGKSPNQIHEYSVGSIVISINIAYQKKKWPGDDHPKTWADVWNVEKFPGPRSFYKSPRQFLEMALMADEVPMDKVYPMTKEKIDRAFKSADRIKKHIKVFWTLGGQSQQIFRDGEVDVMAIWNGRMTDLEKQGVPIGYVWNQGTVTGFDDSGWAVFKGAKNRDNAMHFIDVAARAKPQADFAIFTDYGPTNAKAFDHVPKEVATRLPTYPPNLEKMLIMDNKWWGENFDWVLERFNTWLVSA